MFQLSIKSKLLAMLLGVTVVSMTVISVLNYRTSYDALRDSVFDHLTSLRAAKADQIERYFEGLRAQAEALSNARVMRVAGEEFIQAFAELENVDVDPKLDEALREYYRSEFLPRLAENSRGKPTLENYLPVRPSARYLQGHYTAGNRFPIGAKDRLDAAPGESSEYTRVHRKMHPAIRSVIDSFGFYDAVLIDIDSGDVIYSVRKETDFAVNLIDGPYASSNLALLFRAVQRAPNRGAVLVGDFAHYRPSYGEPAAFIAAPVFDGGKAIAVLAMQISVEEIDRVMTGGGQWERDGLGHSGETILIGSDFRMRSASRFLTEDPERFAEDLIASGEDPRDVEEMLEFGSPILRQSVRTVAAEQALAGRTGTGIISDYRGVEILGSWAPLRIADLDWAIVGKMDLEEAYAPIREVARETLAQTGVIVLVITLAVMLLATSFVRPVNELIARVRRAGSGEIDVQIQADGSDEIGELARSFRDLVKSVQSQTDRVEKLQGENARLLESVLPRGIAQRLSSAEGSLSETLPDVTVLFAEISGLAELIRDRSAEESIDLLRSNVLAFDDMAERFGVETIKTMGDTYMAAIGLSSPLLDGAKRAVDFALELQNIVRRTNLERGTELAVRVGISTGEVVADVVGHERLAFNVWGEATLRADHARDEARPWQVLVTEDTRDRLKDLVDVERVETASSSVPLWKVVTPP